MDSCLGVTDRRIWMLTERPGERIALSAPLAGVRILSATGSNRNWAEAHVTQTLCLIHPGQRGVGAEWRCGRIAFQTGSGEVMAIDPGSAHQTTRVHGHAASFSVIQLDPPLLVRLAEELDLGSPPHVRPGTIVDKRLAGAMAGFLARVAVGAVELELQCRLVEVVTAMWHAHGETRPLLDPVAHRGVRRARDAIHDWCTSSAGTHALPHLAELARIAGLAPARFPHAFVEWVGVAPHAYLNLCRLSIARRMIERGASATEAAAATGFSDLPALSRLFRRRFGLPPRIWQQHVARRHKSALCARV